MNQNTIDKIGRIYIEAKQLAENFTYSDALLNDDKPLKEVMNEYARQVNIANKYRQKEKDLNYLLTILEECKNNCSSADIRMGKGMERQIEVYINNLKSILKVYYTINQIQSSIIKYYEKGGATF